VIWGEQTNDVSTPPSEKKTPPTKVNGRESNSDLGRDLRAAKGQTSATSLSSEGVRTAIEGETTNFRVYKSEPLVVASVVATGSRASAACAAFEFVTNDLVNPPFAKVHTGFLPPAFLALTHIKTHAGIDRGKQPPEWSR
jgi:hypothetical protein